MLLDWLMDFIACFALLPHVRSTPSCAGPWLRTTAVVELMAVATGGYGMVAN
jgi:hypothetical protein